MSRHHRASNECLLFNVRHFSGAQIIQIPYFKLFSFPVDTNTSRDERGSDDSSEDGQDEAPLVTESRETVILKGI